MIADGAIPAGVAFTFATAIIGKSIVDGTSPRRKGDPPLPDRPGIGGAARPTPGATAPRGTSVPLESPYRGIRDGWVPGVHHVCVETASAPPEHASQPLPVPPGNPFRAHVPVRPEPACAASARRSGVDNPAHGRFTEKPCSASPYAYAHSTRASRYRPASASSSFRFSPDGEIDAHAPIDGAHADRDHTRGASRGRIEREEHHP
jgi:hypothetical protein